MHEMFSFHAPLLPP